MMLPLLQITFDLPSLYYPLAIVGLSAAVGFIIKTCDEISDAKLAIPGGVLLALFYGALIAYTLSFTPLSSLWLAAVLAMIITGKMNSLHLFALAPILAGVAFLPMMGFSLPYFLLFFGAAVIDELELTALKGNRLVLDAMAFCVSFYSGSWLPFISIVSFDIAYIGAGKLAARVSANERKAKPVHQPLAQPKPTGKQPPKKAFKPAKRK